MAILPQSICEGLVSVDSGGSLFAGCCALLSCLLRRRTVELKRCSAMYTVSCQYLLDAMRSGTRATSRRGEPGRRDGAGQGGGDRGRGALGRRVDPRVAADHRHRRARARMRLRRRCVGGDAHGSRVRERQQGKARDDLLPALLADAITACTGSAVHAKAAGASIGAPAERALKPGIFALMDSVGDREFQQLHMAFVSGQGGARRMILRKFIDEYRRTHKFDGRSDVARDGCCKRRILNRSISPLPTRRLSS